MNLKGATEMEGFTLSLALVDAIPVLFFGASMILVALRFSSLPFITGAVLSTMAGCFKVAWKLILSTKNKDVKWLNKYFIPMQASGWLLMLISLVLDFRKINWSDVLNSISSVPSVLFFILWIVMTAVMVWYRKKRFVSDDARSNWAAQWINCICQAALFLAILFA